MENCRHSSYPQRLCGDRVLVWRLTSLLPVMINALGRVVGANLLIHIKRNVATAAKWDGFRRGNHVSVNGWASLMKKLGGWVKEWGRKLAICAFKLPLKVSTTGCGYSNLKTSVKLKNWRDDLKSTSAIALSKPRKKKRPTMARASIGVPYDSALGSVLFLIYVSGLTIVTWSPGFLLVAAVKTIWRPDSSQTQEYPGLASP